MVLFTGILLCLTCTVRQTSLAARKSVLHRIYEQTPSCQTVQNRRDNNFSLESLKQKGTASSSGYNSTWGCCCLLPMTQVLLSQGFSCWNSAGILSWQWAKGITEEFTRGQGKFAMGQTRSSQDAQESQAWDRHRDRSLCAAAVAAPHTPGPFPGAGTTLRHQSSTQARKAEQPFCWTAQSQFKIQIMYFRVELWADTLVTFWACC